MKIIALSWTTPALLAGVKTVTRRNWDDDYARRFVPGELVQAFDRSPRARNGEAVMKVYLAARFSRLPELNRYREELEAAGITITSRWLRGGHEWVGTPDDDIPVERLARFAQEDLEDIEVADVIVCFTETPRSGPARGGRHFEAGYAYAIGKPIICVGHRENVFYCLPDLTFCPEWDYAMQVLVNASSTDAMAVAAVALEDAS